MELNRLYQEHIDTLTARYTRIINDLTSQGLALEGLLIHAGSDNYYFADDQHVAFHSVPHFAHWVPLEGPDHLLCFQPGIKPHLFRYVPQDFWYETPIDKADHWQSAFEMVTLDSPEKAASHLPNLSHFAYIGNSPALAQSFGIAPENIEPKRLMTRLDYQRSIKTPYEVACLQLANGRAARGHQAAKAAFEAGLSEREIQRDYLSAIEAVETDTPYGNIIALDEKAAILHYQQKRGRQAAPGKLLLIDAGAKSFGYGSDITRTYLRNNDEPLFTELLHRMERLQRSLVEQVRVGISYVDIHRATHQGVAKILADTGLIKLSAHEILARGFTHPFFPHGVGHLLGIQVHDVAGKVADEDGTPLPPPPEYPFLRLTRNIEAGQVFTIEPGFYFIPMLLAPHRSAEYSHYFDWALIDRLTPLGGIRIEDNIHVTTAGAENLTRAVLSN